MGTLAGPDSYSPQKEEIVSRRNIQFEKNDESTVKSYLDELANKYKPGTKIANVRSNTDLRNAGIFEHGPELRGQMIFEVPVQDEEISKAILDYATKKDIIIRGIDMRKYN